jgi:ABC-2 type transport system ATP-binding protein
MAEPAIRVRDLQKTYARGKRALDGVTFDVPSGCIFGLLGPNGAGKTTLVKALLALHAPTSGQCQVLGTDPSDATMRRRIGYLPEQLKLPEYYRPERFLLHMAALNGYQPKDLRMRAARLLELVGLADATKLRIGQFSKGMVQRLGLAQALLHDPDLLILDEPTDGLDPLGRKEVRDMLSNLRAAGKTVFLNSHLLSEVELICDEVVILKHGSIARKGTPHEFTQGSGEYRIRLHVRDGTAKELAARFVGSRAEGQDLLVRPVNVKDLNAMIDTLRAVPVEIAAIEPVRATMEDAFLSIITGQEDA